jgi:predicted RNA-binding protein with PIN domain
MPEPQPRPWPESVETLIIDGNNVVGAKADGWWRDRPAAVRRLFDRLRCLRAAWTGALFLVLDVPQADLPEGQHDGIEVRYPDRRGRNAADDRIVRLLDELDGRDDPDEHGAGERVAVVSSDRALADSARQRRATVVGAGAFLAHLDDRGC